VEVACERDRTQQTQQGSGSTSRARKFLRSAPSRGIGPIRTANTFSALQLAAPTLPILAPGLTLEGSFRKTANQKQDALVVSPTDISAKAL